jgi:hypothetical protein
MQHSSGSKLSGNDAWDELAAADSDSDSDYYDDTAVGLEGRVGQGAGLAKQYNTWQSPNSSEAQQGRAIAKAKVAQKKAVDARKKAAKASGVGGDDGSGEYQGKKSLQPTESVLRRYYGKINVERWVLLEQCLSRPCC